MDCSARALPDRNHCETHRRGHAAASRRSTLKQGVGADLPHLLATFYKQGFISKRDLTRLKRSSNIHVLQDLCSRIARAQEHVRRGMDQPNTLKVRAAFRQFLDEKLS